MCTQHCRTWLWGGEGTPTYDGEGLCSCVCDDETWSDHNLLGSASCVPLLAHAIFGWVGLTLSVTVLCYASYHLNRQLKFHAQELLASTLPVERCRRLQHQLVIIFGVLCISFFSMVLGDELRWSGVLVSAIQIPPSICGVTTIRMWMYTAGQGVIHKSPEMLALSSWLETPTGHYAACSIMSIVFCGAIILAAVDLPETAIRTTAAGGLIVSLIVTVSLWVCGRSLIRVIDESIEQKQTRTNSGKDGETGGVEDQALLAARKKVKWVLGFGLRQMVMMGSVLSFTIFSKYGIAAPLLLFGIPLVIMPIVKMIIAVQLFAGRTKLKHSHGSRHGTSGKLRSSLATSTNMRSNTSHKGHVVPFENPRVSHQTSRCESQDIG